MSQGKEGIAFGPFRVITNERLIEKDGAAISLSSRAFDILIALIERAGEIVDKNELIARAWPNVNVDESSLRVHIAGLRKALADGEDGARYIVNVPGRGYCFVAPIAGVRVSAAAPSRRSPSADPTYRLPPLLSRMIGREDAVEALSDQVTEKRFVTIHGPGGIGKTTVATAVGHGKLAAFDGAICFFDLGQFSDPHLVPGAMASALGLLIQSNDPTSDVINALRDRRMLLILDSCEHVIDAAAALAERIFQNTQNIHILATSREPLQVEGEHVYRLPALDTPPEGVELTPAELNTYSAVHLLVERVVGGGHRLELTDADAPAIAEICRKLDGIPLAIELAAGRVSAHGLRETAALLDDRLKLLWRGRRTALPRHQTLNATLDWSYDLISELEQAVLRRLSVFVGKFTLRAAQAVAADDNASEAQVEEALALLVVKSLVSANVEETTMRYRLLDTTRAYALAKLTDSGEWDAAAHRHAVYYQRFLEHANADVYRGSGPEERAVGAEHLGSLRAALEWSFSDRGDKECGIKLAAVSARVFLELSLLNECHRWAGRAVALLDDTTRGTKYEMELQAGLGQSLMFAKGNSDLARLALESGLALAEKLKDRFNQFRFLTGLHMYLLRTGNFNVQLATARRAEAVAAATGDPVGIVAAHALLGVANHLIGNQVEARTHLEAALREPAPFRWIKAGHYAFHRNARVSMTRVLWLQGFPDQAVQSARQVVQETEESRDFVTFCIALIWGGHVFQWIGDWKTAEEYTERLIAHATRHSLEPYLAVADGLKGELLITRGSIGRGVDLLRNSLESPYAHRYRLYTPEFYGALAHGLTLSRLYDDALTIIDKAISTVEQNGGAFNQPELLRVRGEVLMLSGDEEKAEASYRQSIELADEQVALSWRLRTATSLARLLSRQGRREEARKTLAETYARFTEGFGTADLKAAKLLLEELGTLH